MKSLSIWSFCSKKHGRQICENHFFLEGIIITSYYFNQLTGYLCGLKYHVFSPRL